MGKNPVLELLEQAEKEGYITPDQQEALDEFRAEQKEAAMQEINATAGAITEMKDAGMDPSQVTGTGKEGRITVGDVRKALKALTDPEQQEVDEVMAQEDSPQATLEDILRERQQKGLTRIGAVQTRWYESVDTAALSYGKGVAEQVFGDLDKAKKKLDLDRAGLAEHGFIVTMEEFKGESYNTALNKLRGLWIESTKELRAARKASKRNKPEGVSPQEQAKRAAEAARNGKTPPKVTRPAEEPKEVFEHSGREMADSKGALEILGIKSSGALAKLRQSGKIEGVKVEGRWFYYVDSLKARRDGKEQARSDKRKPAAPAKTMTDAESDHQHEVVAGTAVATIEQDAPEQVPTTESRTLSPAQAKKLAALEEEVAELREIVTRKNQSRILRPFRAVGRKARAAWSA